MSWEGILKYLSLLLLPQEDPEICLPDKSVPIEILTKYCKMWLKNKENSKDKGAPPGKYVN